MSKKPTISLKDLQQSKVAHLNPQLFETEKKVVKRSKFGSSKTIIDGIEFDSIKEANRYKDLLIMLKHGVIAFLELQVEYELNEEGAFSFKYFADFRYVDARTAKTIVEDCKGYKTKEYLKKKKLMLKIYNIEILET